MISRRLQRVAPSATLAMSAKARQMQREGINVISLTAGEPDFDTPDHIKKAAIDAIHAGFTKYTETSGIPELKKAIVDKLQKDNDLTYTVENILVSAGVKQCLYNVIQAVINPGDEVMIPIPFWVSFSEMVKLADGKCVFLPPNEKFKIDSKILEKHTSRKTKLLILNSPSNPSGVVYSKSELEDIAAFCVSRKILVISDEIYEKLNYSGTHTSIASLTPQIKKLTIVMNGVSKPYAMTGWRIGYCAGDGEIIKAAGRLQDHSTSNPNSIAQKAAIAALTQSQESVEMMKREFEKRRNYIYGRLSAIKGIRVQKPDGAFYIFPDVSALYRGKIKGSDAFCTQLLERVHVAVVPGEGFGDDRCIRLSYATSMENIREAMDRMEKFVKEL